jgi:hypothetical protein
LRTASLWGNDAFKVRKGELVA